MGERPLTDLELLGAMKTKRVVAQKLAASLCEVLDALAVTVTVSMPDGPVKESRVKISAYTFWVWSSIVNEKLPPGDRLALALGHAGSVLSAAKGKLAELEGMKHEAQMGEEPVDTMEPAAPVADSGLHEVRDDVPGDPPGGRPGRLGKADS